MKIRKYLLILVPLTFLAMACNLGQTAASIRDGISDLTRGSGVVVQESRAVDSFSSIELSGVGDLQIKLGDRESLDIEAEDNIIGLIESRVRGSTLEIGIAEDVSILPTEPIRIFVTAVELDSMTVSGDILLWSLVFFLGGFGLYASLMAGAGALVPRMKEAGVASFIVMLPLLIGYMVGLLAPMAGATNNLLLVLMSFFPLTSPVVMIMRLTDGIVPFWQLVLSAVLLYAGAYLTFRSVAAMFHAQNLLSGQAYSIKRYVLALVGRPVS